MKKKTHDEYVVELATKNPTVEVVGEYSGAKTPITHHCLLHDEFWEISPTNALLGHGCSLCHKDKQSSAAMKSHEEYVSELAVKNSNVEVLGQYIDAKTKILHHCLIHDVYWEAIPCNILKGHGCAQCKSDAISQKQSMTHTEYIDAVNDINPNIIVLEKYINIKTPILHRCSLHHIDWTTSPASVLQGSGCPECGKDKIRNKLLKSHEKYVAEVEVINPNIIVAGLYIDAKTPILHKCKLDGNEWMASPGNILSGYGCPKCNLSKGEIIVEAWLKKYNIMYISQKTFDDCKDQKALPFDFYLPEYNVCIEYQGQQHYEPIEYFGGKEYFEIQQNHDDIKREYCKNSNIRLLEIAYYANIEEELNNFLFI